MLVASLADWAVLAGFLTQFGAFIWWASRITSVQEQHSKTLTTISKDLKEHFDEDREFQIQVVERLGSIRADVPRHKNGETK